MVVVDTSVLVDHLRGRDAATAFLRREAGRGPVFVPTLVEWELWKGAESAKERASVAELLEGLIADPFVPAMASIAGDLYRDHRRAGTERPQWDLLIASHALFHEVPVATVDGDYSGVHGLDVVKVSTE